MWPTFYLPPSTEIDFVSGLPFKLCGTVSGPSVTVPTPPEAITGAVHLVILDWIVSAGQTPVFPDSGGPPWRRIFDASRAAVTSTLMGSAKQVMFWRYYTYGDPPLSITLSPGGSGGITVAYTSIVLNRPNTADPWFSQHVHNYANIGVQRYDGASTIMEVANSGDLLIWCSASNTNSAMDPALEPSGDDVEFACTPYFLAPGAGYNGHTMAALQTHAKTVNNLLKHCPTLDPASWTIVGLTRTAPFPITAECAGAVGLVNNVGSERHYAEQVVTLEAGKTYGYFVEGMGLTGSNPISMIWLTYIKSDGTEHGAGWGSTNVYAEVTGSTEVVHATGVGHPRKAFQAGDNGGLFGSQLGFLVTPAVTDTYRFRIYVTPGSFGGSAPVQPGIDSPAGGTFPYIWWSISAVVLQEGPSVAQMPAFIPTGATPVAVGDQRGIVTPLARLVGGTLENASGWIQTVMRRSGGTRPRCVLFSPTLRYGSFDFGDYVLNDTRERHDLNVRGYMAIGTSHVVYDILAPQKYYLELYVNSFGTGLADDAYSIGFCLSEALQDMQTPQSGTGAKIGDTAGQYSYMSTGKTWTDGTQDGGTVVGWQVGDYIGAAIDFANWQITFYRNGTLLKTQAIPSDIRRYALWRGQFGVRGPGTGDKQARFTYNFAGPFGPRLPVGFGAFDFDNEMEPILVAPLVIVNYGFEDLPVGPSVYPPVGWTNNLPGTNRPYAIENVVAREGLRCLLGGQLGDGVMQIHQVVPLTTGGNSISTTLIDAGVLIVYAKFWAGALEKGVAGPSDNDQPKFTLRFLNGGGTQISVYTTGYLSPSTVAGIHVFDEYFQIVALPVGTRSIDIVLDGNLAGGGSGSDAMFDDIRLTIYQ